MDALPPVSVVVGAEGQKFCLDNRRLYILKELRRQGLLHKNSTTVLVRKVPPRDLVKYTAEKCSLSCAIMREKEHEHEDQTVEDSEDDTSLVTPDIVREKNDKKKKKSFGQEESSEERYARQKRIIADKQEEFRRQAAERRLQRAVETEHMLKKGVASREGQGKAFDRGDGAGESESDCSDDDSNSDSEMESDEEVFLCDVCR